jgi:hypothetical protein
MKDRSPPVHHQFILVWYHDAAGSYSRLWRKDAVE